MLSAPHLILVFLVALLVFGPEKLPELARNMSKWMGEFRRYSGDFQETIQREMKQLEQDALEHKRSPSPSQPSPDSSETASQHGLENPHADAAPAEEALPEGTSDLQADETADSAEPNEFGSGDFSGGEYEPYGYNEAYSNAEITGEYDAEWQQESSDPGSAESFEDAATAQAQPAGSHPDAVTSSTEENSPTTTGAEHPINDHPSAA